MQTKLVSAIEAALNTIVGYAISVAIGQYFVYPTYGYEVTLVDNAAMTAIFVGASYIRGYVFRRLFARWLTMVLLKWTSKLSKKWQNFKKKLSG